MTRFKLSCRYCNTTLCADGDGGWTCPRRFDHEPKAVDWQERANRAETENGTLKAQLEGVRVVIATWADNPEQLLRILDDTWAVLTAPAEGVAPLEEKEDDEQLKPCPFCGGQAMKFAVEELSNLGGYVVQCKSCEASTRVWFPIKDSVDKILLDAWNKRAAAPARQQEKATCEACEQGFRLAPDGIHYDDARGGWTWGVCRKVTASLSVSSRQQEKA